MNRKAVSAKLAVYCYDDGQNAGASVIAVAIKICAESGYSGRFRHAFVLVTDHQPETVCECGKFRRRLMARCPTCGHADVQVFELVGS